MEQQIEALKRLHGFPGWRGRNRLAENLFIWRYVVRGGELPGWPLQLAQPILLPGAIRMTQTVWRKGSLALRLDVFECPRRTDAHDLLLRLLADLPMPGAQLDETASFGDVTFRSSADTGAIFARANLVVAISRADQPVIPVSPVAEPFDRALISKPDPTLAPEALPAFARVRMPARELKVGQTIALNVERSEEETEPMKARSLTASPQAGFLKFFARGGEIYADNGRPLFRAEHAGPARVEAVAVLDAGRVARETFEFRIEPQGGSDES